MTTKDKGLKAPDGSYYMTGYVPSTGTAQQAPDGAQRITITNGSGSLGA